MENPRRYLLTLFLLAGLLLAGVAAFSIWVDSNCVFAWVNPARFDAPRAESSARITAAERLRYGRYDTVILGSSRSRYGFSNDDPAWGGRAVYNLSLDDTHYRETFYAMEFARSQQHPTLYVVGADLGMFDYGQASRVAYRESLLNPDLSVPEYYLRSALGLLPETWKNWKVMTGRRSARETWTREGRKSDLANRIDRRVEASERWFRSFSFSGLDERFTEPLAKALDDVTAEGAKVVIVVPPQHASLMHLHFAAGLGPELERWLLLLAETVQRHNEAHPTRPPVELWSFLTYGVLTTEPLDPLAAHATSRPWFYEASHMSEDLGSLLLSRVLARPQPSLPLNIAEASAYANFGTQLTPQNVQAYVQQLKEDDSEWAAAQDELSRKAEQYARDYREKRRAHRKSPADAGLFRQD